MWKTLCALAVIVFASVASFGQNASTPQWTIYKQFHVNGASTLVQPVTLFTPSSDGFYRLSMYMAAYTNSPQNTGWVMQIDWTDRTGAPEEGEVFPELLSGNMSSTFGPALFSPKVGTPVTFSIGATSPPPHDATYDAVFTIEKLSL